MSASPRTDSPAYSSSASPRWAERYLAIPYVDGGRDLLGCDCWGLVRLVLAERCGIAVGLFAEIGASELLAIAHRIRHEVEGGTWRGAEAAQPFDLAVMAGRFIRQDGRPARGPVHVGIVVSPGLVLHTEVHSGPSVAPLTSPAIRHRLIPPFWRHRSLGTT